MKEVFGSEGISFNIWSRWQCMLCRVAMPWAGRELYEGIVFHQDDIHFINRASTLCG